MIYIIKHKGNNISIEDIDGIDYETSMSEEFLSQLTPEERAFLISVEMIRIKSGK